MSLFGTICAWRCCFLFALQTLSLTFSLGSGLYFLLYLCLSLGLLRLARFAQATSVPLLVSVHTLHQFPKCHLYSHNFFENSTQLFPISKLYIFTFPRTLFLTEQAPKPRLKFSRSPSIKSNPTYINITLARTVLLVNI